MATKATITFGRRHQQLFQTPVLEIGAKHQDGYEQETPRDLHPGVDDSLYVGLDIEPGPGVDIVADLVQDPLPETRFNTIHCHCVLEHVPEVARLAAAIEELLLPGGVLFLSVPFAWRIHRIPVDMWRLTPQSLDYIFPRVSFSPDRAAFSGRDPDRIWPIDEIPKLELGRGAKSYGRTTELALRSFRRLGLARGLLEHQSVLLTESNLMLIGVREDAPTYSFFEDDILPMIHRTKATADDTDLAPPPTDPAGPGSGVPST